MSNLENIIELQKQCIQVTIDNINTIPKSDIPNKLRLHKESVLELKRQITELSLLLDELK